MADYLSRYNLSTGNREEDVEIKEAILSINVTDKKKEEFRTTIEEDVEVLKLLYEQIKRGWPKEKEKDNDLIKFYYKFKNELYIDEGLIFFNDRVIIPIILRKQMLNLLHTGHMGIGKALSRPKESMHWPNMSVDVENFIGKCEICQSHEPKKIKEPMICHTIPQIPFSKVGCDIFQYGINNYLVVVDYYSKWIEVRKLKSTTSEEIIEKWMDIFA